MRIAKQLAFIGEGSGWPPESSRFPVRSDRSQQSGCWINILLKPLTINALYGQSENSLSLGSIRRPADRPSVEHSLWGTAVASEIRHTVGTQLIMLRRS